MLKVPEIRTLINVNNMAKIYPDRIVIFEYKTDFLAQQKGYEPQKKKYKKLKTNKYSDSEGNESLYRSRRRTKTIISDLCISNKFDLFATFTFKKDREDIEKCKNKMSKWLENQQKIHGKFEYLIVPEFHKDKKSIHFHALLQNYKGTLKLANLKKNPKKLHNITSYKLGHSTANTIKDKNKTSSYIKKYITKDMPQFEGKKRYWCSRNLKRPETIYNFDYKNNPYLEAQKIYEHKHFDILQINATVSVLNNQGV